MATRYSKFTRFIYFTGDIILLNASFAIANKLKFGAFVASNNSHYGVLALYFNIAWIAAAFFLQTYSISRVEQNTVIVRNTLKIIFLHGLLIAAFIVLRKGYYYSREHLLYAYSIYTCSLIIWRLSCIYFFRFYRIIGYNFRKVIILGCNETAIHFSNFFVRNPQYGYLFLGFFDDEGHHPKLKGKINDVKQFAIDNKIDEIYCVMSEVENQQINDLIEFSDNHMIHLKILPDFRDITYKNLKINLYEDQPILVFRNIPLDDILNQTIKRTFDILFSLIVIVFIVSWLIPILAIIIKLTSRGPVFFKQQRSGLKNEGFGCYKFRTMYVNEACNTKQATADDKRITPVGHFLRKSSLDELPQFFNVLIGNMSVVGPRPHMLKHTEEYSQIIDKYMVRHLVKPGITGLAQIKGYRGSTSDPIKMKNRVKIDIFYMENWSFLLDIKIILLTFLKIFGGDENAY